MADIITLARGVPLKGTAGTTYYQLISDAVDVSAYESIDFQISGSSDGASGIQVDIITSMQNRNDDIAAGATNPSWYTLGNVTLATANPGMTAYKGLSVPVSSTLSPLLRWIRYQVKLLTGVTNTSFTIEGLARRGLRVG